MSLHPFTKPLGLAAAVLMGAACGGVPPTELTPGQTTWVLSLNPRINDASVVGLPRPGDERVGAWIALEPGPSAISDGDGIAVLSDLEAGPVTLLVGDASLSGLQVTEGQWREVAVAKVGAELQVMADVRYRLRGVPVIEIDPTTPVEVVNEALKLSNRVVRIRGGHYAGDLVIKGSNVTLDGEGSHGRQTTLTGNVTVTGSSNRIRGIRLEGDLTMDGSFSALTFSEVTGAVSVAGSYNVFLQNVLCQGAQLRGTGGVLLENRGLAPLEAPTERC